MIYRWREGARLAGDAQQVGEALQRLADSGGLTAERVITAAQHDPVLHPFITWDESEAARLHRLEEARLLIRSITITIEVEGREQPIEERAFVAVKTEPTGHYTPLTLALNTPSMRQQLLAQAERDMQLFEARYHRLTELAGLFAAMRETRKRLRAPQKRRAKAHV